MGIFSALKNAVTGGGAEVSIQAENPGLGCEFQITVSAKIKDNDVTISSVYAKIRAAEKVTFPNYRLLEKHGDKIEEVTRNISHSEHTFTHEIKLAEAQTLKAGETYQWRGAVTLPTDKFATLQGKNFSHRWEMLGGLDARGNDPDSGWQPLEV
jgi:hypothetical protein